MNDREAASTLHPPHGPTPSLAPALPPPLLWDSLVELFTPQQLQLLPLCLGCPF